MKVEVWKKLDDMVKILRKEIFSNNDVRLLQKSCVEFVDAVKAAWGVDHVTHYMVSTSKQIASYHFFYGSCVLPIDRNNSYFVAYTTTSFHVFRRSSWKFEYMVITRDGKISLASKSSISQKHTTWWP